MTLTVRSRKGNMKWSTQRQATLNKPNLCQDLTEEKWRKSAQKSWEVVLLQPAYSFSFLRQEKHLALLLQEFIKQKQVLMQSPDLPFSALLDLFWVGSCQAGEQLTSTETSARNFSTAWESPNTSDQLKSGTWLKLRWQERRELSAWGRLSAVRTSQSKWTSVCPEMVS